MSALTYFGLWMGGGGLFMLGYFRLCDWLTERFRMQSATAAMLSIAVVGAFIAVVGVLL